MDQKNSQDGLESLGFFAWSDPHVQALRLVNESRKDSGLFLTDQGLHQVLVSRQNALAHQARLQWSLDITELLMDQAAQSSYTDMDNLATTISDWFEVVLYIQNQTSDFLADEDVVSAVTQYYENFCGGDIELLRGKGAERIIINYQAKRDLAFGAYEQPGRQLESDFGDEVKKASEDQERQRQLEDKESLGLMDDLARSGDYSTNVFVARKPKSDYTSTKTSSSEQESLIPVTSQAEQEAKAHDLLALFMNELSYYVSSGASSVSELAGRNVFSSIDYTLALSKDKKAPLDYQFYEGQTVLLELMEKSQLDMQYVLRHRLTVPLVTYHDTLTREIPIFFKLYDAQYHAHDTPSLMDYPLANEIEGLTGILYIRRYLESILIENYWVSRLGADFCLTLLEAYERKYDMKIERVPVNVFGIMMDQAFAAALICDDEGYALTEIWETSPGEKAVLWLPQQDSYRHFLKDLVDKPEEEQHLILTRVARKVCQAGCKTDKNLPYSQLASGFVFSESNLLNYAIKYSELWVNRFMTVLKNRCPENMILFPPHAEAEDIESTSAVVLENQSMADDEYLALVEALGVCTTVDEQIQLIRKQVHSRQDLLDILLEDFWRPEEKQAFLESLTPEEQALLDQEKIIEPVLGQDVD